MTYEKVTLPLWQKEPFKKPKKKKGLITTGTDAELNNPITNKSNKAKIKITMIIITNYHDGHGFYNGQEGKSGGMGLTYA